MSVDAPALAPPLRRGSAPGLARTLWLLATGIAVLVFIPGAIAYYRSLLVNPFFGSTVAGPLSDPPSLALAFQQLGLSPAVYAAVPLAREVIVALGCLGMGALVGLRSSEPGAWLISILLVMFGAVVPVNGTAISEIGPRFGLVGSLLNALGALTLTSLVCLFPDGRFAPRWMRWGWLAMAALTLATADPHGPASTFLPRHPVLLSLFLLVTLGPLILSPVYRYIWASGSVQRQQIKWVAAALIAGGPAWVLGGLVIPGLFPAVARSLPAALIYNLIRTTFQDAVSFLIPLTIALSILRYRLWDIDVIIRRTLVYVVLTALLALAYFGSVIALQNIFSALTGQLQTTLVTVLSTLVIAALFVPLRRRMQAFIDRRFYRRKYDAARILAAFGTSARDDVDLDDLTERLLGVVDETMQPASVGLWLRGAPDARPARERRP